MNLNNYNTRTLLVAGTVIIAGSALIIYQLTKSKQSAGDVNVVSKQTDASSSNREDEKMNDNIEKIAAPTRAFPIKIYVRVRGLRLEEKNSKAMLMKWEEKKINYDDKTVSFQIKSSIRRGIPDKLTNIEKIYKSTESNDEFFESTIETNILNSYYKIFDKKSINTNDSTSGDNGNTMCIVNYGHIGSGRINTMLGKNDVSSDDSNSSGVRINGMYYLTSQLIFDQLRELNNNNSTNKLKIQMKYFELNYNIRNKNEPKIRDLLYNELNSINNKNDWRVGLDDNGNTLIKKILRGKTATSTSASAASASASDSASNANVNQFLTSLYPKNASEVMNAINDANIRRDVFYNPPSASDSDTKENTTTLTDTTEISRPMEAGSDAESQSKLTSPARTKSPKISGINKKKTNKSGKDKPINPSYHSFLIFELIDSNNENNNNKHYGRIVFMSLAPSNEFTEEFKKGKWGGKRNQTTETQKIVNKSIENLIEYVKDLRDPNTIDEPFNSDLLCKVTRMFAKKTKCQGIIISNLSPLRDDIKKNVNTMNFTDLFAMS